MQLETKIDLKVIATEPRVFLIENLLSPYELEHILSMAKEKVHRSSVSCILDNLRVFPMCVDRLVTVDRLTLRILVLQGLVGSRGFNSSIHRLPSEIMIFRTDSPVLDHVFSRFSTVLNISDDNLSHNKVAENLQVRNSL